MLERIDLNVKTLKLLISAIQKQLLVIIAPFIHWILVSKSQGSTQKSQSTRPQYPSSLHALTARRIYITLPNGIPTKHRFVLRKESRVAENLWKIWDIEQGLRKTKRPWDPWNHSIGFKEVEPQLPRIQHVAIDPIHIWCGVCVPHWDPHHSLVVL